MKSPWEWTEDDLLFLIKSGEKENISLEYKACDAISNQEGKKTELSKDVSAFANSGGGVIVYGIIENKHFPISLDVGFDRDVISKEWLEQIINSRIQRRIDGIRINQVELTKSTENKVLYVIYIPQSKSAPHQAYDKRFYKRFNFSSIPMEEYEIRDVSRREESPSLTIKFDVKPNHILKTCSVSNTEPLLVEINPIIINESQTPAEYVHISIFIDSRIDLPHGCSNLKDSGTNNITIGDHTFPCMTYYINHAIPEKMPIIFGPSFMFLNSVLKLLTPEDGRYILGWRIYSPKMPETFKISILERNKDILRVFEQGMA